MNQINEHEPQPMESWREIDTLDLRRVLCAWEVSHYVSTVISVRRHADNTERHNRTMVEAMMVNDHYIYTQHRLHHHRHHSRCHLRRRIGQKHCATPTKANQVNSSHYCARYTHA